MQPSTNRLFTAAEAARLADREPSFVRKLIARGELKPVARLQTHASPARYAAMLDDHGLVDLLLKPRKRGAGPRKPA
jgi:hypothetical protein